MHGIYGYIKFVPSEDEIYNEQMNQILKDAKLIKKELNETKSYKTSNTTIINKKIDKLNPIIDNDLKIINKIDESISNTTRKKIHQPILR